ncbi:MAG: hypothetical protein V3T62_09280 [Alphaproteobacteria bacterium]
MMSDHCAQPIEIPPSQYKNRGPISILDVPKGPAAAISALARTIIAARRSHLPLETENFTNFSVFNMRFHASRIRWQRIREGDWRVREFLLGTLSNFILPLRHTPPPEQPKKTSASKEKVK